MELIRKALRVASFAHRNQYRKYANDYGIYEPYIVHPCRVASNVLLYSDQYMRTDDLENLVAAAYLHDVPEDTGMDLLYINMMFNSKVEYLVKGLTNRFAWSSPPNEPKNRLERKKQELEYLSNSDNHVKFIKGMDILDNLTDIKRAGEKFAYIYAMEKKEQLEVIRQVIPKQVTDRITSIINKIESEAGGIVCSH